MDIININKVISLLTEKVLNWYELGIKSIPNILVALLVLIIFIVISKIVRKILGQTLPRILKNIAVIDLLKTVGSVSILFIGLFIALGIMNLDKTVTSILAGAGVLGLALGFAFQEIAANFVSGVLIAFREPYQVGDVVEINDYFGEVIKITLRTSSIMTFNGVEVIIPNKIMFTQPFINYTTTPKRRIDIAVGVSYGDDLDKVEEIVKGALEPIEERVKYEEIDVFFEEFGNSSINLKAKMWIHYPGDQAFFKARHKAVKAIKKAFDKNDITIPFPIRTLDFGIKGGVSLSKEVEVLNIKQ